jgi:hypothetical protein
MKRNDALATYNTTYGSRMRKSTYYCDICSEKTDKIDLVGVRFTNTKKFVVGLSTSTDGKHICFSCVHQLADQLPAASEERKRNEKSKPPTEGEG